jgi:glucose-6-phosphate 1-dehydrogenase
MKKTNLQLIFFGATGDLASLKLFPAICELYCQNQLPEDFQIIGFARTPLSQDQFRKMFAEYVDQKHQGKADITAMLAKHVYYFQGQYADQDDYRKLDKFCLELSGGKKSSQIAYFSVPPVLFEDIAKNLSATLKKGAADFKIVIEKPFGISQKTAEHLFRKISAHYDEKKVFLLDHFLGKRPIQSILKMRMENNVINLMIKGSEIAKITIEASEKEGVGKRIGYYDQVGAIKDMIQSHLLQILALITMDIPASLSLDSLQREKQNILSAVRFSGKKEDIKIGQYEGYAGLEGVPPKSRTETFAAVKLMIDRRDWFKVPVYIKTGKKLAESVTRATIEFKKMPFQDKQVEANRLVFEMKPGEMLALKLVQRATLKDPKAKHSYESVELSQGLGCRIDFCLNDYAALLNEVIRGDHTYFLSYPEIVAAWNVTDKIEQVIKNKKVPLQIYKQNSRGADFT